MEIKEAFYTPDNKCCKIILKDGTELTSAGSKGVGAVACSLPGGEVEAETKVYLSCPTENATIFYTTDGSDPTMKSTLYKSKITINKDTVIKAIAYKDGCNANAIQTFSFTVEE